MLIIIIAIVALFALTVIFGAPYVPTKKQDIDLALDQIDLPDSQVLLDLGAGDGRLLKAAARRGIKSLGYEINPMLWLIAYIRLWPHRARAKIKLGNYKLTAWPSNIGAVYIFGSERELKYLAKRLPGLKRPLTLISYGFGLPDQKLTKTAGPFMVYHWPPK